MSKIRGVRLAGSNALASRLTDPARARLLRNKHFVKYACAMHLERSRRGSFFQRKNFADVRYWHFADNSAAPVFVRYWTKADKADFWLGLVCLLLTQSGHWRSQFNALDAF